MNFDAFLNQAWTDHAQSAQAVANRLNEGSALIEKSEQLIALGNLATHIFGEHLGKWSDGIIFLQSLKASAFYSSSGEIENSLNRFIAILEVCGGNESAANLMSASDQIRIFATSASALSGQKQPERAQKFFQKSLDLAQIHIGPTDPANRALAIAGNNLACSLEENPNRSKAGTELMVLAAQTGRKYWEIAGTWLEVERAEYRLSQAYLQAGQLHHALKHAQKCFEICEHHQAPALEHFFAFEALALAEKAHQNESGFNKAVQSAKEQFTKLTSAEQGWCAASLTKLEGKS